MTDGSRPVLYDEWERGGSFNQYRERIMDESSGRSQKSSQGGEEGAFGRQGSLKDPGNH